MNRSKAKGKAFEREVCADLSKFFGLPFQRVPNSGSFCGGANSIRIASMSNSQVLLARGDIIVPDELQRLVIECKSRKDFAFHHLFKPDGSKALNEWIEQTLVSVKSSDVGIWLLVFKPNNCGKFVVFDPKLGLKIPDCNVHYFHDGVEFIISSLESMLSINKEHILETCKKREKEMPDTAKVAGSLVSADVNPSQTPQPPAVG